MSRLFDSDFLKKLENLMINSKIMLTDGAYGSRKSRSKGSSVEFSDYREYASGDDFRRIDWGAYGRFEKLYIKLFMEEREAPVSIFLDTSKSMDWGEPNKCFASMRLAAALAYISLAGYDRVSVACISSRTDKVKLSLRGKNSLGELLNFLESLSCDGSTDLYSSIKQSGLGNTRGISIVISDLLSPTPLEEVIKLLQYRKQEIYICHLLSPQEVNPDINANLRLVDSETGEFKDVTETPLLLKTYSRVYNRFVSDIEATCFKRAVSYIRLESSMPVEQMVKLAIR